MTKQEAIEILEEVKELDDTMYAYNPAYMNTTDMAIEAFKEIQLYKDNKLCLIPEDVYSRQCSELDAYKEIGTVKECREAVEKQKAKKPIPINYKKYADKIENMEFLEDAYLCPNCKTVIRSGSFCGRCGQKLNWNENLEGMEE